MVTLLLGIAILGTLIYLRSIMGILFVVVVAGVVILLDKYYSEK